MNLRYSILQQNLKTASLNRKCIDSYQKGYLAEPLMISLTGETDCWVFGF